MAPDRRWAAATALLTAAAFVATIGAAPTTPSRGLAWLLVIGSSVHVAATGWLFTVADVRAHARAHPQRYLVAPLALVVAASAAAVALDPGTVRWLLLPYLGWQLLHFQRQNLGLTALAAGPVDRRWIVATGWAGTVGVLADPRLLQVDVPLHLPLVRLGAGLVFAACALAGLSRARSVIHVQSLLFFAPVFVMSSPYAAVGGLTIAHGLQYLLLAGLVGTGPRPTPQRVGLLAASALLGGLALNAVSHLHDGGALGRGLYGAGLGLVMAHLVVDAGLWRQSQEFPRALLRQRVPWLRPSAMLEPCPTS